MTIFAKESQYSEIDRIGRNSIIAYTYLETSWIISSSLDQKDTFALTSIDISKRWAKYVYETFWGTFNKTDFTLPNKKVLPHEFNIRDFKLFRVSPDNSLSSNSEDKINNIIASCFNNGIIFFQAIPRSSSDSLNDESILNGNDHPQLRKTNLLKMTHVINITEAGRIFTIDEYYSDTTLLPYNIFVTHSTPASVFEISINEHFNPRVVRSYTVPDEAIRKYIGLDVLTVTDKYIAHLILDLEDVIEIVRIYYRNESNFAYGHSDLKLTNFKNPISSIHFLDYFDSENIFIRSTFQGELYRINTVELVIDTKNFKSKYNDYVNKTYVMHLSAYNKEKPQQKVNSCFRLIFAGEKDMTSYYIGDRQAYEYGHSYGDNGFSKIVSDFYYGPDLKFDVVLVNSTIYGENLYLPNVTSTNTLFNIRKLKGENNCTQSFFNRFLNDTTEVENIAFYCLQDSFLEKHIFDTSISQEISYDTMKYPRYKFIDFFVVSSDKDDYSTSDELVILGEEKSGGSTNYLLHYFIMKDSLVTWRYKVQIDVKGSELRKFDPLIDFEKGSYMV